MDSQEHAAGRAAIPEFPYQPLNESQNEIRVLSLFPLDVPPLSSFRPNDGEEPPEFRDLVHCTIEHVSLDAILPSYKSFRSQHRPLSRRNTDEKWRSFSNDRHLAKSPDLTPLVQDRSHSRYHRFAWGDYGALSYTWGDQSDKVSIVLNGQLVKVGRNLEAALRALSTDPDYIDGLRLWADAICINQRDIAERNRQVKRMGDIFGRALIVTIWLGGVSQEAIEGMKLVHDTIIQCHDDTTTSAVVNKLVSNVDPPKRNMAVDAIDVLAHASYWSRVWTIQEKCLGPFNPSILLGTFRFALVPLQRFLARATNIRGAVRAREKVWRILKLIELTIANQERLRETEPTSREEQAQRLRDDAEDMSLLLMLGRLGGVVDLRDKLYGLIGMMPEYVTRHIEPDYSKSVTEVFCDFGRALATGFESFDLILTGTTGTDLKLPSWVPDLTDTWDPYLWGTDCRASAGRKPEFHIEGAGGSEIIAKGFQIDVVDGTAPYLGWGNGILSVWKEAVQPTSDSAKISPSEDEAKQAIVRTLHRDATYDCTTGTTLLDIPWFSSLDPKAGDPRVQTMRACGWEPVLRHANLSDFQQMRRQLNDTFRPWGREFRSFFPDNEDMPKCENPDGFIKALDKHCGIVYPVITTEKGHFGTAIRPVQSGDVILVILGSSAPVVSRPKGQSFEVISQCYVEGIMRGEAMELVEKGQVTLQDIRLI